MAGFMFVDGMQNDRSTKRQMRRHVMKGKNAGKTIHRPSRLAQNKVAKASDQSTTNSNSTSSPSSTSSAEECSSRLNLTRRFGSVVATIRTPVEINSLAWQVIDDYFNGTVERVYAPGFGIASDTAKPLWFQAIFADEAAYHCTLALMKASNEAVLGAATGCVLASSAVTYAHYVAESLDQLKRRLAGPQALSNSTILLVLLFISQEQMRHESRNARVHVAGLQQMVALRGGLAHFERHEVDRPLLLKICKIDIVYALQFGTPPLFHRDVLRRVFLQVDTNETCQRQARKIGEQQHSALMAKSPQLYETFVDVLTVALLFENVLPENPIDVFTFGDIFSSLCYRLLRLQADISPNNGREAIYHLGMMMFSMALFLRFDQGRLIEYQPVGQRFREYVEGGILVEPAEGTYDSERLRNSEQRDDPKNTKSRKTPDTNEDETCFWVIMMGGAWTLGNKITWTSPRNMEDTPGWQKSVRKVRQVADRLGLECWDDARTVLDKYPWLSTLHSDPGRRLWDASREVQM
ncbi:hypothetical protein SEUCBS139899_006997 [Sporothrix eucalyptigena]